MAKKIRVKSLIDAHSQMAGMRDGLLREYGRYNREFGAFDAPSRKTKTAKGKEFWAKMDRLGGAYDRTTGVIKANLKKFPNGTRTWGGDPRNWDYNHNVAAPSNKRIGLING